MFARNMHRSSMMVRVKMTPPRYAQTLADIPSRETLLSVSGLEFMEGMLHGRFPHAPIHHLMGYHLESVGPGRVSFRGQASLAHTNPVGSVHGGWYGTMLDSALGCAVMTTVPQGRWYTTLEYKVNLIRALPLETEVIAEGIIDHTGKTTAVAHATIRGAADDKLYATGTTTCIILT
jgi:uncharacterized protein (TIGR00369 family)